MAAVFVVVLYGAVFVTLIVFLISNCLGGQSIGETEIRPLLPLTNTNTLSPIPEEPPDQSI